MRLRFPKKKWRNKAGRHSRKRTMSFSTSVKSCAATMLAPARSATHRKHNTYRKLRESMEMLHILKWHTISSDSGNVWGIQFCSRTLFHLLQNHTFYYLRKRSRSLSLLKISQDCKLKCVNFGHERKTRSPVCYAHIARAQTQISSPHYTVHCLL